MYISEFDSDLVKYLFNTARLQDRARLNLMQELGCRQYSTLISAFLCLLMSLLLQYGSGWESRCFLLLWHLSCAVVISTLTLLEITFLVVVLVQSAHVDTCIGRSYFPGLIG